MKFWKLLVTPLILLSVMSCATLTTRVPKPTSLNERLSHFPIRNLPLLAPARIHWSAHGVPHLEAASDEDLALLQGLVHAHLRLGQMELLKRISQGRLSESAGPFTKDLDRALRTLGFGRATPEIERNLPASTRRYLERYVDGINFYVEQMKQAPHEFAVLNLEREKWKLSDVLTVSRLAATDVNWITLIGFLGNEDSKAAKLALDALTALSPHHKSGSNSWVVAGKHSQSQFPLIANDPHLGFTVPNFWLLIGLKSPQTESVGFAIPGIPIVALGRNADLAWGGTNMRSASSDLVELSDEELKNSKTIVEKIVVRSWWDTEHRYRVSEHGPLLNDTPFLSHLKKPIALKWRGHQTSDEITAFLNAQKAKNVSEFSKAFSSYAVSGQNFSVVDRHGSIGLVRAASVPKRSRTQSYPVLSSEEASRSWKTLWNTEDIPMELNPKRGFIASANDEASFREPVLGLVFSSPQRVRRIEERLQALILEKKKLNVDDLGQLQLDTRSAASFALKNRFLALELFQEKEARELLLAWNGNYERHLAAPVFYISFLAEISSPIFSKELLRSDRLQELWLRRLEDSKDLAVIKKAALRAEKKALQSLKKYPRWEDFHRLKVAHPLGNIPVIGSRYVFDEFGVSGGIETLLKTSHALTSERHNVNYGAQARHISDLSDINENYFVLFGGNDGWLNSANFIDQVPLWREGKFIKVPLSVDRAKAEAFKSFDLISAKDGGEE